MGLEGQFATCTQKLIYNQQYGWNVEHLVTGLVGLVTC